MTGLNLKIFHEIKRNLKQVLPSITSRDRAEALARGLGFKNNTVLKAELKQLGPDELLFGFKPNINTFCTYLQSRGYDQNCLPYDMGAFWGPLCKQVRWIEPIGFYRDREGGELIYPPSVDYADQELDKALDGIEHRRITSEQYVERLREIVDAYPNYIDGWAHYATIRFEMRNFTEAEVYADKAISIAEEVIPPRFKGRMIWGRLSNRPYHRALHVKLLCLIERGDEVGFETVKQKMLRLNPGDNLGVRFLSFHGGDTEESEFGDQHFSPNYTHILPLKSDYKTYLRLSLYAVPINCVMTNDGPFIMSGKQGMPHGSAGIYEVRDEVSSSWYISKSATDPNRLALAHCSREAAAELAALLGIDFWPADGEGTFIADFGKSLAYEARCDWETKHPILARRLAATPSEAH